MRRAWRRLDGALIACVAALCGVGWMVLCSATMEGGRVAPEALHQGACLLFGLGFVVLGGFLDPAVLRWIAVPLYAASVALLAGVLVPGFGHASHGAQRWISLGPLGTLQPSELAKLSLVLVLAVLLGRDGGRPRAWQIGTAAVLMAVPVALIMRQPDLGTALVLMVVTATELFVAGASPALLLGTVAAGVAAAPHLLKGYQRDRLLVFLNPETDPRGMGYNLIQSRMAVGAGGVWGDGLFRGLMSQLHYVPEQQSDFVFSVMGEELGFVGCLAFLLLYLLLLGLMLRVAWRCSDRFGTLLVSGVCALFAFHVFVNMGMAIGLVPVVGIPLPLVSYGGTAVLTDLAAIGLVASVSRAKTADSLQNNFSQSTL